MLIFHYQGMVLRIGVVPAWIGLEDGCLDGSAAAAKVGRAPRCCPGFLLVPSEAVLLTPSRTSLEWVENGIVGTGFEPAIHGL